MKSVAQDDMSVDQAARGVINETALASGLVGLVVGGLLIPLTSVVLVPASQSLARLRHRTA